jgi:ribosomal protein S18 acetylase RimI-like enzyme
LVIRLGSKPIGYALVGVDNGLADLLRIGVLPAYQRSGYGKSVLERVLRRHQHVMLCCRADNHQAFSLYRQAGFRITGELYDASGVRVWVMEHHN